MKIYWKGGNRLQLMEDNCKKPTTEEKKMRLFVSVFVLLLCLNVAVAQDVEVTGALPLTNAGFEAGDVSGWNMWPGDDPKVEIVTDPVAVGTNAAKISGGTGAVYKMVNDEAEMVPGKFYCVVAKVLNPSADPLQDGQSVYVAGKAMTPSGDVWFNSQTVINHESAPDVWNEVYVGVHYPEDATAFNAEFKWTGTGSTDPGCVIVDDVRVIHMDVPADVSNLDAEDTEDTLFGGDGGWWTWSYLPVDPPEGDESWFEDTVSRNGDRCVAMMSQDWYSWSDDWWWGGYYNWTSHSSYDSLNYWQGGDNIYFGAWVMTPEADALTGSVEVSLELTFKDINGDNMANLGYENSRIWSTMKVDENSTVGEWHFLEAFLQCPPVQAEHTIVRCDFNVRLAQFGEGYGIAYVDDAFAARGMTAPSDVDGRPGSGPKTLSLAQNYPNPFNPSTNISYTVDRDQHVRLTVFDILGNEIAVLQDGRQSVGEYRVHFDASKLSSGVYIYRLETEQQTLTKRMVLMQ